MTWPEVALILKDARRNLTHAFAVSHDNEVRDLILTTLDKLDDVNDCVVRKDRESRQ